MSATFTQFATSIVWTIEEKEFLVTEGCEKSTSLDSNGKLLNILIIWAIASEELALAVTFGEEYIIYEMNLWRYGIINFQVHQVYLKKTLCISTMFKTFSMVLQILWWNRSRILFTIWHLSSRLCFFLGSQCFHASREWWTWLSTTML